MGKLLLFCSDCAWFQFAKKERRKNDRIVWFFVLLPDFGVCVCVLCMFYFHTCCCCSILTRFRICALFRYNIVSIRKMFYFFVGLVSVMGMCVAVSFYMYMSKQKNTVEWKATHLLIYGFSFHCAIVIVVVSCSMCSQLCDCTVPRMAKWIHISRYNCMSLM